MTTNTNKLETDENKGFWKWAAILVFIFLGAFFTWGTWREIQLSNNHRFTIATTTGWDTGGWVKFEFVVNGVIYKRSDKGLSLKSKYGRYFVKYYAPDPSVLAKVVSNEEVTDCIGEPPTDGWTEIPKCKN